MGGGGRREKEKVVVERRRQKEGSHGHGDFETRDFLLECLRGLNPNTCSSVCVLTLLFSLDIVAMHRGVAKGS